ncbi:hypothetical protein TELCIR_08229 [Teladorsagia circumcincta]|uniref:Uncharacterized protein n=1 Tax=Teladorsagia circumcincta TaxID=45464 RepID=A0A2G9UI57_TELCI|nr:hypothetical protein TELCIR_08229 [Teladorsagia circumcincta]
MMKPTDLPAKCELFFLTFELQSLECSTLCYFHEFVAECPEAEDALLKVNVGQIHSISLTLHPATHEKMVQECRNVHDTDYMKKRLLAKDG